MKYSEFFLTASLVVLGSGIIINFNNCVCEDNLSLINNYNFDNHNKLITNDIKDNSSNAIGKITESKSLINSNENKNLANNNDSEESDNKKSEVAENKASVSKEETEDVKKTDEQILADSIVNKKIYCFLDSEKESLKQFRKSINNIIKNNDFDNKKLTKKDVQAFNKNIKDNNNLLRTISALFYQIHKDDSDKFLQVDNIHLWELFEFYNKNDNDKPYALIKEKLAGNRYYDVSNNNLLFAIMDYYLKNSESIDNNIDFIEGDIHDKKAQQTLQKYLKQIKYKEYCDTILKEKFDIMSEDSRNKVENDKYAFVAKYTLESYDNEFEKIKNKISVSDWNKVVGKDGKLLKDIKNFVLLINKLQDNIKYASEHPTIKIKPSQIMENLDPNEILNYAAVLTHEDYAKSLEKHENVTLKDKEDAIKLLNEIAEELGVKINNNASTDNKQNDNTQKQQLMPNNQQMMQPIMYPQYQQPMFYNYNPYMQQMMYNNYYQQPQYNPYYNNYYQQQQMIHNYRGQNNMYSNNLQYYQNNNQMAVRNSQNNFNNNTQNNNNVLSGNGIYAQPDAKFLNNKNTSIYELAKK